MTRGPGFYIINKSAIVVIEGQTLSFRNDAFIQEFNSEEELMLSYSQQFPEEIIDEE